MKKLFKSSSKSFQISTVFIKLLALVVLLQNAPVVIGQTYNAPYDIPRFQDFIGGCKLQGPNSNTMATQSDLINGYTSSNFYVADGDKVAFYQTGKSKRTELRHLTNWTLSEGDRSLHGRIKVVQQTCDQVTLMQIHDDANAGNGPNKPLVRIYKHQAKNPVNHLWAAIKTDAGGDNTTHIDLGLAPADYFNCDIRLVGGNMIIDLDGVEKVNMDVSFWTFPSYWKAGVYLQDDGEATAYFDELYLGSSGSGNNPPSVSITSPANGATFDDGDIVTIDASASDSDGSVTQVEFFVDGVGIGVDTSSPYSVNWTIGVGTYDLSAVATDNEAATATSAVVTVTGNSTGSATEAYVSSIVTGTQNAGKGNKHGKATVNILDNNGNPASNASVAGTFSGTFNETVTGNTDSNGNVELVTTATAKGGVSVDLCVDDVTHATLTYNSSLNVITCTGSSARKTGVDNAEQISDDDRLQLTVYPNPSVAMYFVTLFAEGNTPFGARVLGADGRVLVTIQPQILAEGQHQVSLDLSEYPKGIYFLETVLNRQKKMFRLLKY